MFFIKYLDTCNLYIFKNKTVYEATKNVMTASDKRNLKGQHIKLCCTAKPGMIIMIFCQVLVRSDMTLFVINIFAYYILHV